jgi:hypothetical protein
MDAKTFSNRSNAKRAAETAIGSGTALSIDYKLHAREDGRFEIVWVTASEEASGDADPFARIYASEESEAFANEPANAEGEPDPGPTHEEAEAADNPVTDPFPKGTRVRVAIAGQISRKKYKLGTVEDRVGASQWRVLIDGEPSAGVYTCGQLSLPEAEPAAPAQGDLPSRAPRVKPERKPRAAPSGDRKPPKSAERDAAAARGEMPTRPIMTSKANPHYQKRFDQLEAWANAGNWEAVRSYEVKGINSYSKMVARYRQDLLALHAASEAAQ